MKSTLLLASLLTATAVHAAPATYLLDPTPTFVTFEVPHFGTSTSRARFDKKEGSVQIDRAARTGGLEGTIDTASINTGTAPFDQPLQSAGFFNSARYPPARFVADRFVFSGDKGQRGAGPTDAAGQDAAGRAWTMG